MTSSVPASIAPAFDTLLNSKEDASQVIRQVVHSVPFQQKPTILTQFKKAIGDKIQTVDETIAMLRASLQSHEDHKTRLISLDKVTDLTLADQTRDQNPLFRLPLDLLAKIFQHINTTEAYLTFSQACRTSNALYPEILSRDGERLSTFMNTMIRKGMFTQLHAFINKFLCGPYATPLTLDFPVPPMTKHIKVLDSAGRLKLVDNCLSSLKHKFPRVESFTVASFWPLSPFLQQGFSLKRCTFEHHDEASEKLPNTVESLSLKRRPTPDEMRAIMRQCPSLQEFAINNSSHPRANFADFLRVLAESTTLKSLELSNGSITVKKNDKQLFAPSLERVRFGIIQASDDAITNLFTSCPKLKELTMGTVPAALAEVPIPSCLETLELSMKDVDLEILNKFFLRCVALKQLTVRGRLPSLTQINFPRSLERLIISNPPAAGIGHLFSCCPTLKTFILHEVTKWSYSQPQPGLMTYNLPFLFNWTELEHLDVIPSLELLDPISAKHAQAIGRCFPNLKKLSGSDVWDFIHSSSHLGTIEEVELPRFNSLNPDVKLIPVLKKLFSQGVSLQKVTFRSFDPQSLPSLSKISLPLSLKRIHFDRIYSLFRQPGVSQSEKKILEEKIIKEFKELSSLPPYPKITIGETK